MDNSDIEKFYNNILQDIKTTQLSDEEGGSLEQIFTQYAVDLLAEAGETENVIVAYDEKSLGTRNQHKINAYSISENNETLDLFITIFYPTDILPKITPSEVDTASKRIINFFKKGVNKEYVNEIEESSPIFHFAYTLSKSEELRENLVRINALIITNGSYQGNFPNNFTTNGYQVYFRVLDVNYFYNITGKSHVPIEIDFKFDGYNIPCIYSPTSNNEYQSYLAIFPGLALASIYEKFGSRLLEQNVRSFLQFTGKINKGIRNTIKEEPHMFLAFNNGIAATANSIELEPDEAGNGLIVTKVNDFQIVNGGQTTASIYHTWKKDKANIDDIFVQVKLSVVKNKNKFSDIVSRISEYANTQNKVSFADLSSNKPFHIQMEQLSRTMFTPITDSNNIQTVWFYERARGQYKNARIKDGITKARQKAFDLKYPKNQMFTKEELSKYINSYQEVLKGSKILIGPHIVVRGNQKNYIEFMKNLPSETPDSIYYEDVIAKAIIFKSAEKIYGVKPNSIGDMRYITVPYAITWLNRQTNNKLDLFKIWKNQAISENLKLKFREIMECIEPFIKDHAPGSLYGEWAKKEECWNLLKDNNFGIELDSIKLDLMSETSVRRTSKTRFDVLKELENQRISTLKSIHPKVWGAIDTWGKESKELKDHHLEIAFNIKLRLQNGNELSDSEIKAGLEIIDIVTSKNPDILTLQEIIEENEAKQSESEGDKIGTNEEDITIDIIKEIIKWNRTNRRLKDFETRFMVELSDGRKPFNDHNKRIASLNYKKVVKYGFKINE